MVGGATSAAGAARIADAPATPAPACLKKSRRVVSGIVLSLRCPMRPAARTAAPQIDGLLCSSGGDVDRHRPAGKLRARSGRVGEVRPALERDRALRLVEPH